ncbi:MAG: carbohydrate kinase family protein, partial [Terriglobia bacterium]
RTTTSRTLGFALQNLDTAHRYLTERGLSEETTAEFGLGLCGKGSMTGRIVVCGNLVLDILAHPVTEPRWGATTLVDNIQQQLGGNAGSTSYTLARLGTPVGIVTLTGSDAAARTLLETLSKAGVDVSMVQQVDAPTSTAISLIRPDGERALLYHLGAAAEHFTAFELPADATHFHLAAVFRMRHLRRIAPDLLRRAKEGGLSTSLDAQWDTEGEWMKILAPSLPYTDFALMNEEEAHMLTGVSEPDRAAEVLRHRGAKHVIIKLGAKGCWVDGAVVPGYAVKAVDTTGAGDCFTAGFLAALHRGLPLFEAARIANAVGAQSVQRVGATAGILDWNETLRLSHQPV